MDFLLMQKSAENDYYHYLRPPQGKLAVVADFLTSELETKMRVTKTIAALQDPESPGWDGYCRRLTKADGMATITSDMRQGTPAFTVPVDELLDVVLTWQEIRLLPPRCMILHTTSGRLALDLLDGVNVDEHPAVKACL